MDKKQLHTILNTLFLIGALATVVIYFINGEGLAFYGVGIASLIIKTADYITRFFL